MFSKSYPCGSTFEECFERFRVPYEHRNKLMAILKNEGYTEKGICYAAGKAEEKLVTYIGEPNFDWIFINEVRKYAMKPGDQRWNNKLWKSKSY